MYTFIILLFIFILLELNETQLEFQELARKFTAEEIIPVAAHHDRTGEFPWEVIKKAHAVGLMNGHIPAYCGMLLHIRFCHTSFLC